MSKSLGTIGFRRREEGWQPHTQYRADDTILHGRSTLYAKEDHESGDEFDPEKWGFLADATGVQEAAERAEAAAEAAETNAEEAGRQADYAREAGDQATAQAEAAADVTGIFTKCFSTMENAEFVYAIADSEGSLLWGIRNDGSIYTPKGMSEDAKKRFAQLDGLQVMENDKYLFAIVDKNDNVLFALDKQGRSVVNGVTGLLNIDEFEGSEFIYAVMDKNESLLFGVKRDGSFYASKFELPDSILKELKTLNSFGISHDEADNEFIYKVTDKAGRILYAVRWDGESFIPKGIPEEQKTINKRNERRMSDLELRLANFTGGTGDWSNADHMNVPIPRCAMMNLKVTNLPTAKSGMGTIGVTCDIPCEIEFWDMQGNYFKKWCLLSAQGDSSMSFAKKNFAFDIYMSREDALSDGDTFKVKFGDWVPQGSFHLKAYYTDSFRGKGVISYMLYEEMVKTRPLDNDRPYKAEFTKDYGMSDNGVGSITDIDKNFDTGAKCFPMGFPVVIYHNGNFHGVYSFQLKKHRDNFHMSKKTAEHVHLDGTLGADSIFGGTINWTQFEVRNPKDLSMQEYQTIRGEETLTYNGDYPKEIMGTDSEFYDKSDKNMKRCAQAKTYIERLSGYMRELSEQESSLGASTIKTISDRLDTNHTHTSSTGLSALRSCAFIGNDEWLVYQTKDDSSTNDSTLTSWLNTQYTAAMACAPFAEVNTAEIKSYCVKVYDNSAMVDASVWENLLVEAGLDGWTLDFNGSTGKSYPSAEDKHISLASASDTWAYLKIVNVHELYQSMQDFLVQQTETMRESIGRKFKVDFCVDYILETNLVNDGDGYKKNWQWTTWDGEQWVMNPYDHDGIFGAYHIGNYLNSPGSSWLGNNTAIPSGWIIKYFLPELQARWAQLRKARIFDADHIARIAYDWLDRIGEDNMEREYERWPESPCNRDSHINAENWARSTGYTTAWAIGTTYSKGSICHKGGKVWKSLIAGNIGNDPVEDDGTKWENVFYDEEKQYVVGNVCYHGKSTFYGFKCLADCQGIPPISEFYTIYPYELGHYDSVYRMQKWVAQRIVYMDRLLDYTE